MELTCTSLRTPPAMQAATTLRVPPQVYGVCLSLPVAVDAHRGGGVDHRIDPPQRRRHRVGIADLGRALLDPGDHIIGRHVVAASMGNGAHPVAEFQQRLAHVAAQEAAGPGHRHLGDGLSG